MVNAMDTINKRIKLLRKNAGLNQSQLGELLGIKQRAVSMIESGVNQPTVKQIEILCNHFGVSSDYLILGRGAIVGVVADRRAAA